MSHQLVVFATTVAVVLFAGSVFGQPALRQPPPPMVIEPADADAFREIIETQIPPRFNKGLIQWYQTILQRQQDKATAEAKAAAEEKK